MPLPPLTFTASDPVAPYLTHFPEVGGWLRERGLGPELERALAPTNTATTWQDFHPQAAALLDYIALHFSLPRWDETTDWAQESLTDLVHHLIDMHHAYARAEIPRLRHLFTLITATCPDLVTVQRRFIEITTAFLVHMDEEERRLFPLCLAIDQSRHGLQLPPAHVLHGRMHHLDSDHRQADDDFAHLRADLDHCTQSSAEWAALRVGLAEFAADMAVHSQEETAILLPAVTHLYDLLESGRGALPWPRVHS